MHLGEKLAGIASLNRCLFALLRQCLTGWPRTHYVGQAGLPLTESSTCLCLSSAGVKSTHHMEDGGRGWHMPLIPILGRQRSQISRSSKPVCSTQGIPGHPELQGRSSGLGEGGAVGRGRGRKSMPGQMMIPNRN